MPPDQDGAPSERLNDLLGHVHPVTPDDQCTLLMGLADLYEDTSRPKPATIASVFLSLTRQAERDIRRLLAERMAHTDWAPPALIRFLAADEIEIARPVILASPLLRDADLIDLLERTSIEHQIQVAQRPGLGEPVASHIVQQARPAVMVALASNDTARLTNETLSALINHASTVTALRAPLARHDGLDQTLALKLYPWVGEALRQIILSRFDIAPAELSQAIETAGRQAAGLAGHLDDNAASRLIQKLREADELSLAYLLRAAREGRLSLFSHGLAALGEFNPTEVTRALNAESARPLFLACTAVGLDRAAFPALLVSLQAHNSGLPRDPHHSAKGLSARSAAQAAHEFRTLMDDLCGRSV
ncbi:DUF2336 domain-containing protein [Brevundimonas vesicularis]|uniref:DUF2336 domain-containing protein n=1 Tax=Brevundimonas vesicularis TaxID=41276 RepID=UPI0038D40E1F